MRPCCLQAAAAIVVICGRTLEPDSAQAHLEMQAVKSLGLFQEANGLCPEANFGLRCHFPDLPSIAFGLAEPSSNPQVLCIRQARQASPIIHNPNYQRRQPVLDWRSELPGRFGGM
jgi:hypothetical protein